MVKKDFLLHGGLGRAARGGRRGAAALIVCITVMPIALRGQDTVRHKDTVRALDEVLVRDARVGERSPFGTSTLSKEQLAERKTEVSVPYMLELQPSVVVAGENGKMGETTMRIRGVDGSRINVNLNGITLNEAESQSVFWYNLPNLGGMVQSMQIQRGIGASTGGTASQGAAINLQTLNAREEAYGAADISLGSWNTRQYGIAAGTGVGRGGWALDLAYNGQTSDGYVRGGAADQQSLFATASRYGERSLLKAVLLMGRQHTGITWNGESAETLDADPRHNSAGEYADEWGNIYYYPNESDNYTRRRYQLCYSHLLGEAWSVKAVGDFTHGDGYYEQYKAGKSYAAYGMEGEGSSDFIVQKKMLTSAFTGHVAAHYGGERLSLTLGQTALCYDGDHWGEVLWEKLGAGQAGEYYRNNGSKWDATTAARLEYAASEALDLYAAMQMRLIDYRIEGLSDDLFEMRFREGYAFFNPKAGASWQPAKGQRLYMAAGLVGREPARSDIKDAIGRGDTVRAEEMLDIEAGYKLERPRMSLSANAYAMLYKDQLTPSGDLSSDGYALMENVDRSYRLGLELAAGGRLTRWLRIDGNATLSSNKIIDYRYTDFDPSGEELRHITATTDLAYSPSLVAAAIATAEPLKDLKLQLAGKYVGSQYLDNTSRDCYRQEPYFLLNAKAGYVWRIAQRQYGQPAPEIEVQLAVNNLLDNHYRIGAWAADDYWDGWHHYAGWYQQPGINVMSRLVVRF